MHDRSSVTAKPGAAARTDPVTGIRHELEFFGLQNSPLFGAIHLPVGVPTAGVVICSPIAAEFGKNYRREVRLAEALSAKGFAVQRFHYRGTGHSGGDPASITFRMMTEDAAAAATHLQDRTGVSRLAFVGTRFGALIAAGGARVLDHSPLVLWDPITVPARYFREVARMRLISDLAKGVGDQVTRHSSERSTSNEPLDVLGFRLDKALLDTTSNRTLANEVGEQQRPLLLVQMSTGTSLRRDYSRLKEIWEDRGSKVSVCMIPRNEVWWIQGAVWEPDDDNPEADLLIGETTAWLSQELLELEGRDRP